MAQPVRVDTDLNLTFVLMSPILTTNAPAVSDTPSGEAKDIGKMRRGAVTLPTVVGREYDTLVGEPYEIFNDWRAGDRAAAAASSVDLPVVSGDGPPPDNIWGWFLRICGEFPSVRMDNNPSHRQGNGRHETPPTAYRVPLHSEPAGVTIQNHPRAQKVGSAYDGQDSVPAMHYQAGADRWQAAKAMRRQASAPIMVDVYFVTANGETTQLLMGAQVWGFFILFLCTQ